MGAVLIRSDSKDVLLIGYETPLYWAYSIYLQTIVIGTNNCNSCVMSDNLTCYCYGSRGLKNLLRYPTTPQRGLRTLLEYLSTPCRSPSTQRMRGERTRVIILLMMMNMRTNQECLLILKII